MKIALISDIHGNIDALEVVMAAIDQTVDCSKGDEIWCLGDTIGYGPDPLQCLDVVQKRCAFTLLGNHDFAVLYEPTNFNAVASEAARWTRGQFESSTTTDPLEIEKHWLFLNRLRVRVSVGPFLCVHGSPRRPINEYIFPADVDIPNKLLEIFKCVEHFCLVGHTHVPGVFTEHSEFYSPSELSNATWKFDLAEKVLVNPGSVGQPRDLDPRASYAIMDVEMVAPENPATAPNMVAKSVQFFRVQYDIDAVRKKIDRVAASLYHGELEKHALQLQQMQQTQSQESILEQITNINKQIQQSGVRGDVEVVADNHAQLAVLRATQHRMEKLTDELLHIDNEQARYRSLGERLLEGR